MPRLRHRDRPSGVRPTGAAVAALTLVALTACTAGPSDRPAIAIEHQGPESTLTREAPAPAWLPPATDLRWSTCTPEELADFVPDGAGVPGSGDASSQILECAWFIAPVDDQSGPDTFVAEVARLRDASTPADAPPVVLTSGADRPARSTLVSLAGPLASLVAEHPVVALDHRGSGGSLPVRCVPRGIAADLHADGLDPRVSAGRAAAMACADTLAPVQQVLGSAYAGRDLDALRRAWSVPTLAILGIGAGASTAVAFAAEHPGGVAQLVLDSPVPFGVDAATAADALIRGRDDALADFARQCRSRGCTLADPEASVRDVAARAQGGALPGLDGADVAAALADVLADPDADRRIAALAPALSAAAQGDTAELRALVPPTVDGAWAAACTDGPPPPGIDQLVALRSRWATQSPVFGAAAADALAACTAWPTGAAPQRTGDVDAPVTVLTTAADPVTGDGGPSVQSTGLRATSIRWMGTGHSALHSPCAVDAVRVTLNDAASAQQSVVCPA